jgi:hypothetical protein
MIYLETRNDPVNGRNSPERASSNRLPCCLTSVLIPMLVVASFAARPLIAQDTTRTATSLDSLAERLRRAEEAIATLREQLATQAESQVQSASRVRVELFGRVLANGFFNSDSVNNSDVPQLAAPSGGRRQGGLGGAIRQTSLGVRVDVPRVLGATFNGELHTDFFGGQQPSVGGRHFPVLRIRTARGVLSWQRAEILFGQEVPLIAGLNPVSVASFGTSEFAAAGNLWLWLPQLRGTWIISRRGGIALQGALLAPTTGDPVGTFDTGLDPAERSNRPYLQARVRSQWGNEDARGEIGVGLHQGWIRRADAPLVKSDAVAVDARIPLGSHLEIRGEAYSGQALRGLGGGGVGQNLTTTGNPVEDRGGWGQLVIKPNTLVDMSAGCGVGDPNDVTGLPAGRLRNVACEAHVTTHPGGPVVASFGWRSHRTTYQTAGVARNTHLNLALGFEF